MKNHEIVLVSPPSRANTQYLPLAYIYLAGWLKEKSYPVHILDIKENPYKRQTSSDEDRIIEKIVDELEKMAPRLVGIGAFTSDYRSLLKLTTRIKSRLKTRIVVGGVHATLRPEDFIYHGSPVDIAVIGEGEETLTELAEIALNDQWPDIEKIKGILYAAGSEIKRTDPRPVISDLAVLPRPAYELINMDYYTRTSRGVIRPLYLSGTHITTSRGCPFQCTFCANRNLWNKQPGGNRVRYKSLDKVIDELEFLKNTYRIDGFYIADDTFTMRKGWAEEFCRLMAEKKLDMIWAMETRVELINESLLLAINKAGCIQVEFGVESGSPEALNRMKKGSRVEDTVRAFELCHQYKMRTFANILFNTPGETTADVEATLKLMKKIKADHYGVNMTIPLIGTDIYDQYVKPPMTREEYRIFEHPQIYTRIIDERFRMTEHNRRLDWLYFRLNFGKYINSFLSFTANRRYWQAMLRSQRKREWCGVFCANLFKQLKSYIRFVVFLWERLIGRKK